MMIMGWLNTFDQIVKTRVVQNGIWVEEEAGILVEFRTLGIGNVNNEQRNHHSR